MTKRLMGLLGGRYGWMMWLILPSLGPGVADGAELVVVPTGAVWKYLDDGSNQDVAWRASDFDDGTWASGPAQLGYGDGDEATVVSFGPASNDKFITTYFRHTFGYAGAPVANNVLLRLLRDDGAVVYLNGIEVYRSNMTGNMFGYLTRALSPVGGAAESVFLEAFIDPSLLVVGDNVLAVEVHQVSGTSSDISLDVELIVDDNPPAVTRGPYLQSGTPSSMVVRWGTAGSTDGRVTYGDAPGNLTFLVDDPGLTPAHQVTLAGLTPNTRYYYSVGTSTEVLAGDDADHFFETPPTAGTVQATRVWAIGDSGTANASAAAVFDAYLSYTGTTGTDVWLMLGDNAYNTGTDAEYQLAVFDMYPNLLRQSVLWPTLGNHDAGSADSPTESGVYYDIFTLPRNGEAGGWASGTEAYYSFDRANIHFICLDSQDTDRSVDGAMLIWLENDLADTMADWIIAFWHHPPYTRGSHNSDNVGDSGGRMTDMRQNVLPILEAGGVDMVLSGHSHSYERSFLLDGHYGLAATLGPLMVLNGGDGREGGQGAYAKASAGPAPHEGAVYMVAGSSGKTGGGILNHPAMFVSLNVLGSVVLDIVGHRLDATFLQSNGVVGDSFTIIKDAATVPGDFDLDGDVDLLDHSRSASCMSGPGGGIAGGCYATDGDGDGDVDMGDLRQFLAAFTGSIP